MSRITPQQREAIVRQAIAKRDAILAGAPTQPAPASVPADQFWLIERGPNQGWPRHAWWNASPDGTVCGWKSSVHEATPYPTKEAAERVIRSSWSLSQNAVATSHGFLAAAPAPSVEAQPVGEVRLMQRGGNVGIACYVDWGPDGMPNAGTKLYASPIPASPAAPTQAAPVAGQARMPLTDEQIEQAYKDIWNEVGDDFAHTAYAWIEAGIRYAEKAHGIEPATPSPASEGERNEA